VCLGFSPLVDGQPIEISRSRPANVPQTAAPFQSRVDVLAHMGGLAAGLLVGLALVFFVQRRNDPVIVVTAVALAIVSAGIVFTPAPVDKERKAFQELEVVEKKVIARWNEIVPKVQSQEISDAELADIIENELLPPWRSGVDAFEKSGAGDPKVRPQMLEYLNKRQLAWETMAKGLRASDVETVTRGAEIFQESDELIKKLNARSP
jgi:hypothetical protein